MPPEACDQCDELAVVDLEGDDACAGKSPEPKVETTLGEEGLAMLTTSIPPEVPT